ncbi:MAG: surface carbohydrate biosynthesis protein, partial [Pseudomonadota bacterium]
QVFIGSRAYVHFEMARFPRGIYVAKSMRSISDLMFQITDGLGHRTVAWEEEALVHPPAEIFYSLRMSPKTLPYVSDLFCWGEDNRQLASAYEHLPSSTRLHVTGNPRGDMLRPELRPFFAPQADAYRERHGHYVLINTNFNDVNPYIPAVGLFQDEGLSQLGQAGKGMDLTFARGLHHHKLVLFRSFLEMIEVAASRLPEQRFVVRPHPSEQRQPYLELSERFANVETLAEGNVLPWLLAAKVLVHNGCTTAVEGYAMDVPAITYMPIVDQLYDYDFQGFPNRVSLPTTSLDELVAWLGDPRAVTGEHRTDERTALLAHHLTALDGPFASERIVEVLDGLEPRVATTTVRRTWATVQCETKRWVTELNMGREAGHNRRGYHDLRFPPLTVAALQARISSLAKLTTLFADLSIDQRAQHIFELNRR